MVYSARNHSIFNAQQLMRDTMRPQICDALHFGRGRREGVGAPATLTFATYLRGFPFVSHHDATLLSCVFFCFSSSLLSLPYYLFVGLRYDVRTTGNRNGTGEVPDLSSVPGGEEMAGLWAQYHSALGLAKGKATPPAPRDQSVRIKLGGSLGSFAFEGFCARDLSI